MKVSGAVSLLPTRVHLQACLLREITDRLDGFSLRYAHHDPRNSKEEAGASKKAATSGVLRSEKESTKSSCNVPDDHLWLTEGLPNVHVGVGCDSCGMYPMHGKRYNCKDCTEAVGYDLCEACYNTSSKLPGRFNQQHTPDHKFELNDSQLLYTILMIRAMREEEDPQQDGAEADLPYDDQQDLENHDNV